MRNIFLIYFFSIFLVQSSFAQTPLRITNQGQHPYKHLPRDINAVDSAADEECATYEGSTGQWEWQTCSSGGAPTDADYLVGTTNASLSAEIVAGATPGGELGGTWDSPTIDIGTLPNRISAFASSVFASNITDETGSKQAVYNDSPTLTSLIAQTSITFELSNGADIMTGASGGVLVSQDFRVSGKPSFTNSSLNCASFSNGGTLTTGSDGMIKCSDDDSSAGGGDSITVNSSAATDPDFADGDIDWTLTGGNSITATVNCSGCVDSTDLGTDSVSADELNATGVESELEAVLDLDQLQGQISDTQIATGAVDGGSGGEISDNSITLTDDIANFSSSVFAFALSKISLTTCLILSS